MSHAGHGPEGHKPEHKMVGLMVAVIAMILAVVTMVANATRTEAMLEQIKVNDGWSFFQAKKQRQSIYDVSREQLQVMKPAIPAGSQAPADQLLASWTAKSSRYDTELKELEEQTKHREEEVKHLNHRMEYYEFAETLLHVGIVLCSITMLTDQKLFYRAGIAAALLGMALALFARFAVH